MHNKIKLIIAVPPQFTYSAAGRADSQSAHMIYGIKRGFRLYSAQRAHFKGGYMVLDTSGFRGGGPVSALASDIINECNRMEYAGLVIDDAGSGASPALLSLSKSLAYAMRKSGLSYFVPEKLDESGFNAIVRVPTALSGGTLHRHLTDAVNKYGVSRIALEIKRVCMDFTLPALTGIGKELTQDALINLKKRYSPPAIYSTDLAVNYFTYTNKNRHFVLYDDAASIRNKLSIAENLGIETAFLYYPQVSELLFLKEK